MPLPFHITPSPRLSAALRRAAVFLAFLTALLFLNGCALPLSEAEAGTPPKTQKEIRGLWVTRWDFHAPEDMRKIIQNAVFLGCNRVYLQVRGEGTCFFHSNVEPWAWELTSDDPSSTGRDPGWDPLKIAMREARDAGIELHAYLNVLPTWNRTKLPPASANHVITAHRDWVMVGESGRPMTPPVVDCYPFLNPAYPEVRAHITRVFTDLARQYPGLDGIHLDYIRYPGEAGMFSFDKRGLEEFKQTSNGRMPRQAPDEWNRWRASKINLLVADISREVRRIQPNVEVSAAVFGDCATAYQENAQFWLAWPDLNYVDSVAIMAYHYLDSVYRKMLAYPLEKYHPRRGKIIVGIMPDEGWLKHKGYTMQTLARQIETARQMGADGISLFSYGRFFPGHQPNEWARFIRENCFRNTEAKPGARAEDKKQLEFNNDVVSEMLRAQKSGAAAHDETETQESPRKPDVVKKPEVYKTKPTVKR